MGVGGDSTWALSWAQILGHVNLTNVVPLCASFIPFPFPFLLNQLRPINYQTVFLYYQYYEVFHFHSDVQKNSGLRSLVCVCVFWGGGVHNTFHQSLE